MIEVCVSQQYLLDRQQLRRIQITHATAGINQRVLVQQQAGRTPWRTQPGAATEHGDVHQP